MGKIDRTAGPGESPKRQETTSFWWSLVFFELVQLQQKKEHNDISETDKGAVLL